MNNELNELLADVKTGDLILFGDRTDILSHITRICTQSNWTHIGIICRLPEFPGEIFVFESSNTSSKFKSYLRNLQEPHVQGNGIRLVKLADKLSRFKGAAKNMIHIVRLRNDTMPTEDLHELLWRSMQAFSSPEYQYKNDIIPVLMSSVHSNMRRFQNLSDGSIFRRSESDEAMDARREIDEYVKDEDMKLFCSETIALMFQSLGIMESIVMPKHVVPSDFDPSDADSFTKLPFTVGWSLEPFLSLHVARLPHVFAPMPDAFTHSVFDFFAPLAGFLVSTRHSKSSPNLTIQQITSISTNQRSARPVQF